MKSVEVGVRGEAHHPKYCRICFAFGVCKQFSRSHQIRGWGADVVLVFVYPDGGPEIQIVFPFAKFTENSEATLCERHQQRWFKRCPSSPRVLHPTESPYGFILS